MQRIGLLTEVSYHAGDARMRVPDQAGDAPHNPHAMRYQAWDTPHTPLVR